MKFCVTAFNPVISAKARVHLQELDSRLRGNDGKKRTVCLLVLLFISAPVLADNTAITVTNAWVRAAPPTVSMHAGYATLKNADDKPVSLVKITSPQFGSVQVHESFIENGMAKMRHVVDLVVEPGAVVQLVPGGYHLMLMQANTDIETGQQITFIFYFSNGETVKVTAPVQRTPKQQIGHKTHHNGH